jgi:hypothetical protein
VTGGGAVGGDGTTQAVNSSFPDQINAPAPNAWHVDMNNVGATASDFFVYAICAPAASASFGPVVATAR